jgi:uncharacterized membrane protein
MAIEFECPECRATLRVGDDARGKKAQCPQCGKISELPSEVAPPSAMPVVPVASMAGGSQDVDLGSKITKGPLLPSHINFSAVLSRGWKIAAENYGIALAGSAIFLALSIGVGMVANSVAEMGNLAGDPVSIQFLVSVSKVLFDTWLTGGATLFFLNLTRRQVGQIGEMFSGGKYLWRILGVNLLLLLFFSFMMLFGCGIPALIGYIVTGDAVVEPAAENPLKVSEKEKLKETAGVESKKQPKEKRSSNQLPGAQNVGAGLAQIEDEMDLHPRVEAAIAGAIIGMLVILIPMIILGIMFSQAVLLVVDRGVGSIEAIRQSIRITRGNKMALFLLGLISACLAFAGILACGIGLFFVMPFIWVIAMTAYLAMTSQLPQG